jgi:hypothetical protein
MQNPHQNNVENYLKRNLSKVLKEHKSQEEDSTGSNCAKL